MSTRHDQTVRVLNEVIVPACNHPGNILPIRIPVMVDIARHDRVLKVKRTAVVANAAAAIVSLVSLVAADRAAGDYRIAAAVNGPSQPGAIPREAAIGHAQRSVTPDRSARLGKGKGVTRGIIR